MSDNNILDNENIDIPELNPENTKNTKNNIIENEPKTIWDEIKEFWNELIDLLYIDLHNSYLFLIENKNYFIYAVILAILLQFTSINNISTSVEKYCKKSINNLSGGGGEEPSVLQYTDYKKGKSDQKKADQQAQRQQKQAEINATLTPEQLAKKQSIKEKLEIGKSRKSSKKAYLQAEKAQKLQDDESKANQKRISFFEKIKAKFGKGSKWGGQYGALGPVFGNMEKIFDSVKTVFYIITIILTIAGILSIPVLIFLIITYMIIKTMVGKFIVL